MAKTFRFVPIVILAMLLTGCPPTPSPCPPLTGSIKATPTNAATGEISSISIANNTYAYHEDGSDWCSLNELSMSKIDLTPLPACPGAGCLSALDVKPDNIRFDKKPGTTTTYPQANWAALTFDLSKNPHNDVAAYAIYQYTNAPVPWCGGTSPWCYVGSATKDTGADSASGKVKHFSTFALVLLPPPTQFPPPDSPLPIESRLIVASEFIDNADNVTVSLEWTGADIPRESNPTRLYHFFFPEMRSVEIGNPDECPGPTFADRMTCFFPPGTVVGLIIGENQESNLVVINSDLFLARFYVKELTVQ